MHFRATPVLVCLIALFAPGRLLAPAHADTSPGVWREQTFEDFIDGTFGDAGHNLYVSRAGVLQRIYRYDANRDGYFDLVICNAQNHWEKPPAYVYPAPFTDPSVRVSLPSDGSRSGTVADLNGDGYDDLILGMWQNGIRKDLNAYVYFGSERGYSERRHLRLPAPLCKSVASGDFNGDGKMDLAFLLAKGLRVFLQTELGFEGRRFVDLAIDGEHVTADDLDGDGFGDLVVRTASGDLNVYWGGAKGLDLERRSTLRAADYQTGERREESDAQKKYTEYVADATPLPRVVRLKKAGKETPHLFLVRSGRVYLIPVTPQRAFQSPLSVACPDALSVAAGDVNGDGLRDLVFACRDADGKKERSWVYFSDGGWIRRCATDAAGKPSRVRRRDRRSRRGWVRRYRPMPVPHE